MRTAATPAAKACHGCSRQRSPRALAIATIVGALIVLIGAAPATAGPQLVRPFRSTAGGDLYRISSLQGVISVRLVGYPRRQISLQSLRRHLRNGVVGVSRRGFAIDPAVALRTARRRHARRTRRVALHRRPGGSTGNPDVLITAGPANGSTTTATTASFSFTSGTSGVGFRCSLDSSKPGSCTSPKTYSSLRPGRHTFSVEAVKSGATGARASRTWTVAASTGIILTGATPPTAPGNLTAAAGDGRVSLSWGAASDSAGVAGYTVYRNGSKLAQTTSTSYADTGVTDGTTYSYYVTAYDAAGNVSAPSNTATATPIAVQRAPQTSWTSPGTQPLSDSAAAAQVSHQPEIRSDNTTANDYVPSDSELASFRSAAASSSDGPSNSSSNPNLLLVDGRDGLTNPSTDDLIQWTAHKWGIPEDWIRAEAVTESRWHQSQLGDCTGVSQSDFVQYPSWTACGGSAVYQSMGLLQVRWTPEGLHAGTEPLRWKSVAFNLDYYGAIIRYYYDGRCDWCGGGYSAGQQWNTIGAWFNPSPWGSSSGYVQSVQGNLNNRTWAQPGF